MDATSNAPIIIKRKKVVAGGGHHGGAWKVAYADFVTAMMAFFMLMWLLNATTEQQRKGIADYFAPSLPISRTTSGGDGMFGGESIFSAETLAQTGSGGVSDQSGKEALQAARGELAQEQAALEEMQADMLGMGGESDLMDNALRHIVTHLTEDGLVIEIFDTDDAALFFGATDTPEPVTQEIARMLARLMESVTNDIAISGHVRAQSVLRINNPVWELSTSRAARMRLLLQNGGLDPKRIVRQTGAGDRDSAVTDPSAVRNNRIEVVVLRSDR